MISMNNLGENGRLGNQMFQYASIKGIAANRNLDFMISDSPYNRLQSVFDFSGTFAQSENYSQLSEKDFYFDQNLFDNCPDNTNLSGYFQSYKYFLNIEQEIKKDFTFRKKREELDYEYVSIHVRRGDYVNLPDCHPLCSESYYYRAKKSFPSGTKFLLISDDPAWCLEQEIFRDCKHVNTYTDIDDLFLMTRAVGNIIANSTFSWWGAYLNVNHNKTVVAPIKWFGIEIGHHVFDLIPPSWILI